MKRKWTAILCLIALLMNMSCAGAQSVPERGAALTVVNCEEYINLRTAPDPKAEEMCEIGRYDTVVFLQEVNGKFYQVGYRGMIGYANRNYLIPSEWIYAGRKTNTEVIVTAERDWMGDGERAAFSAHSASGKRLWTYLSETSYMTELTLITGFYAGTDEQPLFMIYNAEKGLTALDLYSGRELWTLYPSEVHLGGSITWAVGEDGTMYIGGYYGPDPVAISADGEVLWQSSSGDDDAYWLYDLWLTPDSVWAIYEYTEVFYDRESGAVID